MLNRSLATVGASTAALILNLTPVFAVGSAVVVLREPLMTATVAGGVLILAGLIAVSHEPELVAEAAA